MLVAMLPYIPGFEVQYLPYKSIRPFGN